MTPDEPKATRPIRKLTFVGLGVNVLASAGWWWVILGVSFSQDHDDNDVGYWAVTSIPVALVLTVVGICLAATSGGSGGANRVIGIVGGLLLLSPIVAPAVLFIAHG